MIKNECIAAYSFWRKHLKKYFFVILIIFAALSFFSISLFSYHPEETRSVIESFEKKAEMITSDSGDIKCLLLILSNLIAAAIGAFSGAVPFIFIPAAVIVTNALIIGAGFAYLDSMNVNIAAAFAGGVLPHGIFEITALILCAASGFYMCFEFTKTILSKRRRKHIKYIFSHIFYATLRLYVCLVIPLMFIAGIIESFITPKILSALLS